MAHFQKIVDGIRRLDVPFDHLYTSVFLIEGDTPIIIDSATTESDVNEYILPALCECGITAATRGILLLTHKHGDHSGGAYYLLNALPRFTQRTLCEGETVETVTAVPVGGHTLDSMGYLDVRTNTLLCGDGLQFYGVGKYGCSITDTAVYNATLDRIDALVPTNILPAHAFVGGGEKALGEDEVKTMLANARTIWEEIQAFVKNASESEPSDVSKAWRAAYPDLPPLPSITVRALRA